jgi:hypothetical protein
MIVKWYCMFCKSILREEPDDGKDIGRPLTFTVFKQLICEECRDIPRTLAL